jgi:hypothetical protein
MVRRGSTASLLLGLIATACSQGSGNANPDACALAAGAPLESGGSCPRSTAAYCATAGQCPPLTWSDVRAALAQPRSCWPGSINECGTYDLLLYNFENCDGDILLFAYDKSTGHLEYIFGYSLTDAGVERRACVAGEGSPAFPSACGVWSVCAGTGQDAGTE